MAFALAKENEAFIRRMLELGRYNNQSEVVREALRRMEREESSYLNPPALKPAVMNEIYRSDPKADAQERTAGRNAMASVRRAAKKFAKLDDL